MFLRLLRIAVIAVGFALIFAASQAATRARGDEPVPGLSWAIGVLALIFTASAVASERLRGPEANLQKDLFWGLAVGGFVTVLLRF